MSGVFAPSPPLSTPTSTDEINGESVPQELVAARPAPLTPARGNPFIARTGGDSQDLMNR